MRLRQVAGGLIFSNGQLLLVKNDRHYSQTSDWSTPGGVVDKYETVLEGLTREVTEETGLLIQDWQGPAYNVQVDFLDRGFILGVQTFIAGQWEGKITLEDPDGIVTAANFCSMAEQKELLSKSPLWVREPLLEWQKAWNPEVALEQLSFRYEVVGISLDDFKARRYS